MFWKPDLQYGLKVRISCLTLWRNNTKWLERPFRWCCCWDRKWHTCWILSSQAWSGTCWHSASGHWGWGISSSSSLSPFSPPCQSPGLLGTFILSPQGRCVPTIWLLNRFIQISVTRPNTHIHTSLACIYTWTYRHFCYCFLFISLTNKYPCTPQHRHIHIHTNMNCIVRHTKS